MNDTAQLAPSTATAPSQGDTGAPAEAPNMGTGAPPTLPTNAPETSADASSTQPQDTTSAPPADKSEAPPASLTNPKSVASTAQTTAPEAIDPAAYKRLRDESSQWGRERQRMANEMERIRQQATELQQFREESLRKAQQANLKRWDAQHPDQRKFEDLIARRERAREQLARVRTAAIPEGLPPELHAKWRQSQEELVASDFSDAERQELAEFDRFQQEAIRGLTTNAPATIGKIVQPMIRSAFQEMIQELKMQREVMRDQEDPALKPLFERFGDDMAKAMEQGVPYDQAVHYTKVYGAYEAALAENARLKQQMEAMSGKVSQATVQQELAKGKASITRDVQPPKTSAFLEARKWARENGIDTDSDAFRKKVRELEQR